MRQHCCDGIRTHLQVVTESQPVLVADRPILYDPVFDEYRLVGAGAGATCDRAAIAWCPWCGTSLPPSQRDRWFAELDALGVTPDDEVPERFRTDIWWRGRADHD